ncbi:MAG: MFS transporter [Lachnospiraceae bacterium]|nr:MFS transporter [Lachnospiraceae bacterium]
MSTKNSINGTSLLVKNCMVQGAYWASVCTIAGFASVLLLSKGFSNSQIGLALALGNILGVICQPVVGALADSSKKLGLHSLSIMLSTAAIVLLSVLYFIPNIIVAVFAVFVATVAIDQTIQPLVNSVSVYYISRGVNVDFGISRGIGSLTYAIASTIVGKLVTVYDESVIILASVVCLGITSLSFVILPKLADNNETKQTNEINEDGVETTAPEKISIFDFIKKYKYFCLTLVGGTFLLTNHNIGVSYMIQILNNIGGNTEDMGMSMSIAALVELPVMFLFTRLMKKFKASQLIKFSALAFAIKGIGFLLAMNVGQFLAVQVLQMFTFGMYIPAGVYLANECMEEQDKFKGQALMAGTNTLGGVVGSLVGGLVLDMAGVKMMLIISFAFAAAGFVLVFLYAGRNLALYSEVSEK